MEKRTTDPHSPMHQFEIGQFGEWQVAGFDASFSKAAAFMIAAVAIVTLFLVLTTNRRAMVRNSVISEIEAVFARSHSSCSAEAWR